MYRLVAHTADIAIECDGPSQRAVLADAATGLAALVTGRDDPRLLPADAEIDVTVEAPDPEALVVAWLSEVLWLVESEDRLWLSGGVELGRSDDGGLRLHATGNAVRYDPVRHGRGTEVKAVTYHDLHLGAKKDGWHLRVVLDI